MRGGMDIHHKGRRGGGDMIRDTPNYMTKATIQNASFVLNYSCLYEKAVGGYPLCSKLVLAFPEKHIER
jgi:hypothetical protein